jgi:alpha-tubulin suppressor-like RCC1 family protein
MPVTSRGLFRKTCIGVASERDKVTVAFGFSQPDLVMTNHHLILFLLVHLVASCGGSVELGAIGNSSTGGASSNQSVGGTSSVASTNLGGCAIDGIAYNAGDSNPQNPCQQTCQPQLSQSSWSMVAPVTCATELASGYSNSCAIANYAVYCWGAPQMAYGSATGSRVPVIVQPLTSGAKGIAVSYYGSRICAVANSAAYCWSHDGTGLLGDGTASASSTPVQVQGLPGNVQAVAAGDRHSCAIVEGALYCWGVNSNGQLGDGTTIDRPTPVMVSGMSNAVQAVSSAGTDTCAVRMGVAYCWGYNGYINANGAMSSGSPSPQPIPLSVSVDNVTAGVTTRCVTSSGAAYCWGPNWEGMVGDGTTAASGSPQPVLGFGDSVQQMVSTEYHTCGVRSSTAYCWGRAIVDNGDAGTSDKYAPTAVAGLSNVTRVSTGDSYACAIDSGRVLCWGGNSYGELGNGSTKGSMTPVHVSGL